MNQLKTLAASALLVMAAPLAQAEELSLAHFMSPNHPYHDNVFNWLGEELNSVTGGELTLRVYPGGELGAGPVEQYNRAIDGVADIAFALQGYTAAQFPRTLIMDLPGQLEDPGAGPAGYQAAMEWLAEEYRRVELLAIWNINHSVLYTADTPVRSLADVDGLKIRVASRGAADLVEAWGAVPVFMPVTDIYTSMQTGVIDGALIDPSATMTFRLGEVATYLTTGFDSIVTSFMLVMNRDSYADLTDAQRAALDEYAGLPLSERAHTVYAAVSERGQDAFAAIEGNEVIVLDGDAAAEFNTVAAEVRETTLDTLEAEGIPAREIAAAMQGQ